MAFLDGFYGSLVKISALFKLGHPVSNDLEPWGGVPRNDRCLVYFHQPSVVSSTCGIAKLFRDFFVLQWTLPVDTLW